MALPGEYMVKIRYNGEEQTQSLRLKNDPRFTIDSEMMRTNYQTAKEAQKLRKTITSAGEKIEETKKAIQTVMAYGRNDKSSQIRDLVKAAKALDKKLNDLSEKLNPTPPRQGIADRSAGLRSQVIRAVMGITRAGIYPITEAAHVKYEKTKVQAAAFLEEMNMFYQTDLENFKKSMQESGFSLFKPFEKLEIESTE